MSVAIKIENLSKQYRLGLVSTRTLSHDLNRWWQTFVLGREDPYLKIGQENKLTTHNSSLTTHNSPEYVWALKDINLEVEKGEVLGIIGKNGAGKSTLLKILSKVTAPSTGTVKARGRIASLLEVGTGFHQEMTGRENIFMNGSIMGMTKAEITRKLEEIVDFAGVEKYIDTPVKRYSSGMTVRLGFAIAAHLEPEILVVDEVLAVGDAEFQKKAIGKMQDVSRHEGRTVLFVSHNMAAISALCNRAVLLNNGLISFMGNVEDTLNKYLANRKIESDGVIHFNGKESERFGEKKYAKWLSMKLHNQNDDITDILRMGELMKISLELEIFKPSDDFEIGIGIGTLQEVYSHYLVSTWEGFSSIKKTGKTIIEVEIPQLVLFPGNYLINIWICVKGAYYDDAIHNAIQFRVEEGKVNQYDTYFERFSKNTQVYTPTYWSIK